MLNYCIAFINTSVSSTKDAYKIAYTRDKLSLELITSPPRKKFKTTFESLVGVNYLRCTKILSQCHHFLSFLPSPFLSCKDTFMDDY